MSWGQAFGAFGGGLSSGYNTMEGARYRKAERAKTTDSYQSGIERLVGRPNDTKSGTDGVDEVTQGATEKTWQIIRDMESEEFEAPQQGPQAAGGGLQISPTAISQFMGGGSGMSGGIGAAGGGVGGSGLIGSAGGAVSAGSNGGASFGLGGSLVGGSGTVGGSTFAAGSGAAGGSAAGGGSALASAGPWAALAAIVLGNESAQRKTGNRAENDTQYAKDLIGGKVVEQDMKKYADKWDEDNEWGLNSAMNTIGNASTGDFSNAWKHAKKGGHLGALLKKLF